MQQIGIPQDPCLKQTAIISMSGNINPAVQNAMIDFTLFFFHRGCTKIIYLINTWGGSIDCGISIYNFLKSIPIPLIMHNIGTVESIGIPIFMAGTERYACQSAKFMHHEYLWPTQGAKDLSIAESQRFTSTLKIEHERVINIAKSEGYGEDFISNMFPPQARYDTPSVALTQNLINNIKPVDIHYKEVCDWRTVTG